MDRLYNLDTLRSLSLFTPDVRLQQVTLTLSPDRLENLSRGGRTAEVLFVLRRSPDKVLLVNRAVYPPDTYRLPTGGIEAGESLRQAASREIYEETGYRVDTPDLLGVIDYRLHWPAIGSTSFVSYIFTAEVEAEQAPQSTVPGEIDAYRWVSVGVLDEIAAHLRRLPDGWASWGRFRSVSYEFIQCGMTALPAQASRETV